MARDTRRRRLRWAVCFLALVSAVDARAQQASPPVEPAPAYKLFRYDEDYSYLRDPNKRTDIWDPVKYIPLGSAPGWYLSFGGELRERFEFYSHPNFGLQGQGHDAYLLHRTLWHADLHAGDYLRAFVQLGSHLAPWKDAPAPPYLDRLDLQQAFVDVRLPLDRGADLDPVVRVGRQEMVFGSQRLVSIRDAPNVRRNFDGVRVGDSIGEVRVDAFLTRPVLLRPGAFDDPSNREQTFWGVYTTAPVRFVPGAKLDLYYLGFDNERARFAIGAGEERRQTFGARFFGAFAGWDWDWEALGQFGTFAQQSIRAWGISTDTGYTLNVGGRDFRVGLKADVGSGDRNPNDAILGTLNPLFPKLAYFNQAALLGPSNVMDLQPTLGVKLTPNVMVTVGYDFLWRTTTADAIYTGAGVPIAGTAGRAGQFTGRQFSVDVAWRPDRHVELSFGYVHFDAAKALRQAGGQNVEFAYLSASYKF